MKLALTTLLLIILGTATAQDSPDGKWTTHKGAIVEIFRENDKWHGKLVQAGEEGGELGKIILRNFQSDGDKLKGEIYSPKAGKFLNGTLERDGDEMEVSGKAGFITRSFTWTRAK